MYPYKMAEVHLGTKRIALMQDAPIFDKEFLGELPLNKGDMYWALCTIGDGADFMTRDATCAREFIADRGFDFSDEQVRALAIIFCYLLKLGHIADGPYLSKERAVATFGIPLELICPRLERTELVFYAETASPSDLLGELFEYHYDIVSGKLERSSPIQPIF